MYEKPPNDVKLNPVGGATTPYQFTVDSVGSARRAKSNSASRSVQNVCSPPRGAVPKFDDVVNA